MRTKLTALLFVLFLVQFAYGQAGLGSIAGTVLDASHASIPNATIKVLQLSTNSERTTNSNDSGLFMVPSLVPSTYKVTITATGFKERTIDNLDLTAFQNLSLGSIEMAVGGGTETVDVTAEAVQLDTVSAVRDSTVTAEQVAAIPALGRNWVTMLRVIPGSQAANSSGIVGHEEGYDGLTDFKVNGKAGSTAQMNLDGGPNIDHGADGKTTVTPALESIQEISVLTNNYQAQYGSRQGVVVNVTTKSGSNTYHATAWDYVRNEALNANSHWYNMQGLKRPYYRYNYFGGNIGGPILKNKVFLFANNETMRVGSAGSASYSRVPTALERIGDFSQTLQSNGNKPVIYYPGTQAAGAAVPVPNNILPPTLVSPVGKSMAAILPMPNYANDLTNNYVNTGQGYDNRWLNVGRLDWNVTPKNRFYLSVHYDYEHRRTPGNMPWTWSGWDRPDRSAAANVTSMITPMLVVENTFAWQLDFVHAGLNLFPDVSQINVKALGLNIPLVYPVHDQYNTDPNMQILPTITNSGFYNWGFARTPWFARAPEYTWSSTWTWVKGNHMIKGGLQIIVNKKNEWDNNTSKGSFDFAVNTSSAFDTGYTQSNFLTGAINQFQQVDAAKVKYSLYQDTDIFLQDTWKVHPNLTLDYGVRFYHAPGERDTRPDVTQDAQFVPSLWNAAKAPRFYVPNPANTKTLIDPANPNNPLPASVFNSLLYSIVPGSGDLMNGVVALNGKSGVGNGSFIKLGPRGGFSWQFARGTVLRGGFGISFGRFSIGQSIGPFEGGLANSVDYRQTSFATLQASSVSRISPRDFGGQDPSTAKPPRMIDFSLTLQRELPGRILLDVGYVGNLQQHQYISFNINTILPGTSWLAKYVDPRLAGNNFSGAVSASNPGPLAGSQNVDSNLMRPYTGLGALATPSGVGNNRYNALQINAQKRYSHGLNLQAVYSFGKLITETDGAGRSPYYMWKSYSGFVQDGDRAQTFTLSYTYEVPSLGKALGWNNGFTKRVFDNWSLAHVLSFMSGPASTPSFGTSTLQYAGSTSNVANLNSIFTGSPDITPRILPTMNPNGATDTYHMLNTSALTLPAVGTDGRGSLSYYFAPGTFSNDVTLTKQIPIREPVKAELRASIYNLFNTPRHQDVLIAPVFKANGATSASGYTLFNTPENLVANLLKSTPTANAQAQYNIYRTGVGSTNMTSVLDARRIELSLKVNF